MSRGLGLSLVIVCALALGGCVVRYDDDAPPGLDDDLPTLVEDDVLVFERELRWWQSPTSQRVRLYRRVDGSYLLLRRRLRGDQIYAWAEGALSEAGSARLDVALSSADPSQTEPVPGQYDCTYVDALPATIYVDDEAVTYLSLCPPQGLLELAALYEDLVELLLDCPLDPAWYPGEVPVEQLDCAAV